ncbi:DUF3037 domain-containing protein [Pedobacter sp. HMWF019]|uniref:DUF3037 domain-containing protein n=1 Tax=Pedobacter sp. HMWF019 TaxID=2056856 RepID=UPI000D39A606|nr:DUF3037 domain-containing protein [Pedobacter sp. HMWF019]PTS99644.1 DUF3037 domain-containing protein [Pedobacter sp. HMWF019]
MQERDLYEYAIIRVVPRVEREEFMNIGVILFCAKQRFLEVVFHLDKERLAAFCPQTDIKELYLHLKALQRICSGEKEAGPIAQLDRPSRFRWLTATRSTVIQASKVHPGFCDDAATTLEKIYRTMVL